jgi:hypothetical protein
VDVKVYVYLHSFFIACVNACTHFPLVERELAAAAPAGVRFVDGGPGIARRVAALTQGQAWADPREPDMAVFTRWGGEEAALAIGRPLAAGAPGCGDGRIGEGLVHPSG